MGRSSTAGVPGGGDRERVLGGGAENATHCIDVTEVRAFLVEKKVSIKELSDEPDEQRTAPKPRKEETVSPPPGTVDPPKTEGSSPADQEKAAAQLLSRARLFANDADNRPTYVAKLKEVVTEYPGTKAATEAQKKLDELK